MEEEGTVHEEEEVRERTLKDTFWLCCYLIERKLK